MIQGTDTASPSFTIRCHFQPAMPQVNIVNGKQTDGQLLGDEYLKKQSILDNLKGTLLPSHLLAPEHHDDIVHRYAMLQRGRQEKLPSFFEKQILKSLLASRSKIALVEALKSQWETHCADFIPTPVHDRAVDEVYKERLKRVKQLIQVDPVSG